MTSDDVPYEDKLAAYIANKQEHDPDHFDSRGRFIVNERDESGDWLPVDSVEPRREVVERWYERNHGKGSGTTS